MDRLWAPWRSNYIESFNKNPSKERKNSCLFCEVGKEPEKDEEKLILFRGSHSFVIMNLYPYNSGHLMVVPYKHLDLPGDLSDEELLEIMHLIGKFSGILSKTLTPHGFNIGANIGRVSGAGIEHHIHFHIVPRWNGDTNFMPVLGGTKVISEDIKQTYHKIKDNLDSTLRD